MQRLAVDAHFPTRGSTDAEEGLPQATASRADEAVDPHDLAGPDLQVDVPKGVVRRLQTGDLQASLSKDAVQLPTHHGRDQTLASGLLNWLGLYGLPVSKDGDSIADFQDLFQPVADVNDGRPLAFEAADVLEQAPGFLQAQRRGRFVQKQNLYRLGQRPGNLRHDSMGDGESFRRLPHVQGFTHFLKAPAGLAKHLSPVDPPHPAAGQSLTQQHVFSQAEGRKQIGFLVHGGDAQRTCLAWTFQVEIPSVEQDTAGIGFQQAVAQADQGALAGSVFSHQAVDFTGTHLEVGRSKRPYTAEAFGDIGQFQDRFGHAPDLKGATRGLQAFSFSPHPRSLAAWPPACASETGVIA